MGRSLPEIGLTATPGAVQHRSTATQSAVNASDKLPPNG